MCGPALPLSLLLWIIGATAQSRVTAPASLTAEAGRPIVLGCNITTAAGDTVRQVRWLKNSVLLLAYEHSVPIHISQQHPNVKLNSSNSDSSYITIKRVQPADDGCYRCVFDVFPSGKKEGSTCITVTGKVHVKGNKTAIIGSPVTLSCSYSMAERVQQVLWRKTAEQGDTTKVASCTKHSHHTEEQFKGRVRLTPTLGETKLTFDVTRMEDEACYTCEFHTFPDGTRSATTCLSVYVLPKPEVSHVTSSSGVMEANCTAQSRPAAYIMWDTGGDNRTLGPPILSLYEQGDGTTTVTSTLLFQTGQLNEQSVTCIVQHQGLKEHIRLPLHSDVRPAIIILISVCGVAMVLLLCLCVCLCKSFVCIDD
ncbi:OX-2 membrane glycoprotein-like [Kryptolebias marmoratus]|uniref:Sc:d189 n=1 Tax=Kryptolebias marmoratus TaxID=37003 RepID=A0A3Q2ZBA3_KRYMA|nr:OX-2 membrane glycoprotein-like [Kryptolebias marmoratus]XP_017287098.1 OX-2 membrane glycoprotein-like [Kryptolebias marmoratus]